MAKKEKLLEKAQNNPSGLRLSEFETLLKACGWLLDHQRGSHRIWYSQQETRLPIQKSKDGKAKGYQVRQFLRIYDEETNEEKNEETNKNEKNGNDEENEP